MGYPSKTHLKLKCREVSFAHNLFRSCPIVVKFCTEHDSDSAVIWANFFRCIFGRIYCAAPMVSGIFWLPLSTHFAYNFIDAPWSWSWTNIYHLTLSLFYYRHGIGYVFSCYPSLQINDYNGTNNIINKYYCNFRKGMYVCLCINSTRFNMIQNSRQEILGAVQYRISVQNACSTQNL